MLETKWLETKWLETKWLEPKILALECLLTALDGHPAGHFDKYPVERHILSLGSALFDEPKPAHPLWSLGPPPFAAAGAAGLSFQATGSNTASRG